MSTRMYNYRLPKEQWWPFAQACRQYYLTYHPMVEVLQKLGESADQKRLAGYRQIQKLVDAVVDADWTVDLQLFEEGDNYLIRPLEQGYFFMNNCDDWVSYGLERVYYDNRSDVSPEDEKNEAVAEWVDEKILARQYLTYTVLDREDFMAVAIDRINSELGQTLYQRESQDSNADDVANV